jgi:hypothetical protein
MTIPCPTMYLCLLARKHLRQVPIMAPHQDDHLLLHHQVGQQEDCRFKAMMVLKLMEEREKPRLACKIKPNSLQTTIKTL